MDQSETGIDAATASAGLWQTKARTLARVVPLLRASRVPPSLSFEFGEWCRARAYWLAQAQLRFGPTRLAVRSSHRDEDQQAHSHAGRYRTELNVPAQATEQLTAAIEAVFHSYNRCAAGDEVLLQPMVEEVRACCVAATRTLDEAAPYYVLDYAQGVSTDLVTRGAAPTTAIYLARDVPLAELDDDTRKLLSALRELERLHPQTPIEAEFVLARDEVVLLQVRPIAQAQTQVRRPSAAPLRRSLRDKLRRTEATDGTIYGARRLYAQMPDWNPAELIGVHPRPLARSLFRRLITQSTWREARASLGYRALDGGDLLEVFAGRPYVDVRRSFNSFLPQGIAALPAGRLIDAWLARLQANPELHDKVEFEIASTCVDFDFIERQEDRYAKVLTAQELRIYREQLLTPTRRCLDGDALTVAVEELRRLQARLRGATAQPVRNRTDLRHDLDDAVRSAALPFARLARQAFVAEALLRSAERRGALDPERRQVLRSSIDGVAGAFFEAWRDADTAQERDSLREQYGHLRPGTFEITVPCYAAREVPFFGAVSAGAVTGKAHSFTLTARERAALDSLCAESGLDIDATALIEFYRSALSARECGKFVLSSAVSNFLEHLAEWARPLGIERDCLAWLDLQQLLSDPVDGDRWQAAAAKAQRRHERERQVKLPLLLAPGDDLRIVRCAPGQPTFHGGGVVEARIVAVDRYTQPASLPPHCIVAIESADPGFDWIFARAPVALVTAYGGPNSHMAIRCAELACPAVLGYGAEGLRRLLRGARAAIDFDSGVVRTANH